MNKKLSKFLDFLALFLAITFLLAVLCASMVATYMLLELLQAILK